MFRIFLMSSLYISIQCLTYLQYKSHENRCKLEFMQGKKVIVILCWFKFGLVVFVQFFLRASGPETNGFCSVFLACQRPWNEWFLFSFSCMPAALKRMVFVQFFLRASGPETNGFCSVFLACQRPWNEWFCSVFLACQRPWNEWFYWWVWIGFVSWNDVVYQVHTFQVLTLFVIVTSFSWHIFKSLTNPLNWCPCELAVHFFRY